MSTKTAVLEANEKRNAVDELKAQIERIQNACSHQFKVIPGSFHLGVSKVKSVLLGSIEGNPIVMSFRCAKCSLEKKATAETTCPVCAGEMVRGDIGPRDEYFSETHLYHAARLYHCKLCKTSVAIDEWDQ